MWTSILSWLQGLASSIFTSLVAFISGSWWQKEKTKRKSAEKKLKGIQDAKAIHDRVDNDDDFRRRVRDKYR